MRKDFPSQKAEERVFSSMCLREECLYVNRTGLKAIGKGAAGEVLKQYCLTELALRGPLEAKAEEIPPALSPWGRFVH